MSKDNANEHQTTGNPIANLDNKKTSSRLREVEELKEEYEKLRNIYEKYKDLSEGLISELGKQEHIKGLDALRKKEECREYICSRMEMEFTNIYWGKAGRSLTVDAQLLGLLLTPLVASCNPLETADLMRSMLEEYLQYLEESESIPFFLAEKTRTLNHLIHALGKLGALRIAPSLEYSKGIVDSMLSPH